MFVDRFEYHACKKENIEVGSKADMMVGCLSSYIGRTGRKIRRCSTTPKLLQLSGPMAGRWHSIYPFSG